MSILEAIILGIVQGLTEFLPVSSSGHLTILQNVFQIQGETGLFFEVMLHLGTLAALIVALYKDIEKLVIEFIRICIDIFKNIQIYIHNKKTQEGVRYQKIIHNNYRKFVVLIILSTIPTGIIGFVSRGLIKAASTTLLAPGIGLLVTGLLLVVTDFSGEGHKIPKDISYSNGFFVGIAQGLATFPGISRSGTTIAACVLSGFDRKFAVKYSFIMSIPAIIGAMILELFHIGDESLTFPLFGKYFVAMIIAGVVGYFCIQKMLTLIKKKKLRYFAYYCFAVGIATIVMHFVF